VLCIAVISANRPEYLRPVLRALHDFLKVTEPNLVYHLIWIDQGTPDRAEFLQAYHFNKTFFFDRRMGNAVSFRLAFSQSQCEFLFLLEEDWLAVDPTVPWFSHSISLLRAATEDVYCILLRKVWFNGPVTPTGVQSCVIPSGVLWKFGVRPYHYTNGAAVYRMSSLQRISRAGGFDFEVQFSRPRNSDTQWPSGRKPTGVPETSP
jgi:hypothetical protein